MIKVYLNITMSKIMAYLMLVLAFVIDMCGEKNGTVYMVAMPIVASLVLGKQYIERNKDEKT